MSDRTLPFGKYEGRYFSEVPRHYLAWLVNRDWLPEYKNYSQELEEGELYEALVDFLEDTGSDVSKFRL